MHVGIGCSGTYGEAATVVTTTRAFQTSTTTPSADEQTVIDVLNRHNWTDIAAVIDVTGRGIYSVYANEGMTKVKEILNTAKRNGGGGDTPENDIEAIIYTLSTCSTCKNVIHIADNGATPRDMILLNQVTKPIKVVVCKLGENSFVNPKLLDIAYKTGGSLHTLDMDIETLGSFEVGDTIKVGDGTYRLTVNGFVRVA
ncbi:unnamed protein product [Rotaria magnacalcarata]|uniref:Uncharacterized protein n=1 Tax=Rotaria magnacalcarata TaxID=392030 RepID=A0A820DLX1_9BILA|nr:unnamed protein product [Rotaria magnacalcarata]CAF4234303.1 unnamed protein product [Rotaria magnacalcarata]